MSPNYIALAVPFFVAFIAIEYAVARAHGRKLYRTTAATADLGCGIVQQVLLAFFESALIGVYTLAYDHVRLVSPAPWLAWVLGLVGVDFAYYWWHRASHRINALWAAHVVHHHSEDYNLAVALRQSVLTPATELPFFLPLAVLGVPPLVFAAANAFNTLYQFWIHTELLPKLGAAERVINTPSHHRVHHAINPRYLDKNYGGTLMVWDRLFGTLEIENESCVYGTTKPLASFNPIWAQFEYWVQLFRGLKRAPSFAASVSVFTRGPDWHPEWWPAAEAPAVEGRAPFELALSATMRRYVLAQFSLLMATTFAYLMWGGALSPLERVLAAAWTLASLGALAGLLEERKWARGLELARWIVVPLVIAAVR